jgi:cytochrome c biogenesis protein CcmG, thiol:disulfide interchange protein DsbE
MCRWLAALLILGIASGAVAQSKTQSLVNRKAPEFAQRDLNGQTINLARLRGKVVLLNFWATWCAPCLTEMPAFAAWQRQYGQQGLTVVGISMDDEDVPVRKMVKKLGVDYPVAMGNAALGERYGGVLGLPMTFLIDRNGIVRARFQGEADLKKIEASLKGLLDKR